MDKVIRIGTRDSELALWQANTVKNQLEKLGYKTALVPVKSTGDLVLDKPLYEMGITGIFTKTLDVAMLNGTVDIAVHSMKDVPTALPKGIIQSAVLARAEIEDVLVTKTTPSSSFKDGVDMTKPCTIATGSLRRKAQWLNRYPHHTVVDLRGNVQTRLQKLKDNDWDGAVFAKAGLERLGYLNDYNNDGNIKTPEFVGKGQDLNWMLPAPAQGAMVIVTLQKDDYCTEAVSKLNNSSADICTQIERDFLRKLEGGCTAPIGALAELVDDDIHFKGCLFSLDGKKKIEVAKSIKVSEDPQGFQNRQAWQDPQGFENPVGLSLSAGINAATELLENGGVALMKEIKKQMST